MSTVQQRYRTEDGTYAEIDNQIVPIDQSAQSTDPFKAQGYDYRTKASQYWVLMKQNVSHKQTVAIAFGDRRIAFSPIHQADLD